jgi:methyl-accepting chemotaxis protein
VLVVAGLAIGMLIEANLLFEDYVEGVDARALAAARVRAAIDLRAIAARNLVLVSSDADRAAELAIVEKAHADATQALTELERLAAKPKVPERARSMIAEIVRVERAYSPVALEIVDLAMKGQRDAAIIQLNETCRPLLAQLIQATDDYAHFTASRAQGLVEQDRETFARERNTLVMAALIALLFAIFAGYRITRGLLNELGAEPAELRELVGEVAKGNLATVTTLRSGDSGSVLAMVQRMQASLSEIVAFVRQNADSVSSASEQISASNLELSSRTVHQATSLEQTASSMEQFSSTVQQNAESARKANQLARNASTVAEHGGQVVGDVVQTMHGINDSSRRIYDIIDVIDEIAFQTNILALNAAVEAARAGDEGKGFAVVAAEVRSLAVRSSEAAREIKELISASVQRVERGAALVDDAGKTMADIVSGIREVASIIGEISIASEEQSKGVTQVSHAVGHMDRSTQENAAMVEEMSAAASDMYEKAHRMVESVRMFRLADAR